MPDYKSTIALDDRDFASGANRVERRGKQMGKEVNRAFAAPTADELVRKFATVDVAFQTIRRGVNQAGQAVSEYSAKWPELESRLGSAQSAVDRMRLSIGRDLFFAMNAVGGQTSTVIDRIEQLRQRAVNFVADVIHGDGAAGESDRARQMQERQIVQQRAAAEIEKRRSTIALDLLGVQEKLAATGRGDTSENVLRTQRELAEVEQKRARAVKELNTIEGISANQKNELIDAINRQAAAEARLVRVESTRRASAHARDLDKQRRDGLLERQRFDIEERSLRIGLMQMEGNSKEAQIERVRLDFARRRLELEQKGLDVAEKRRRMGVLNDIEQRTLAATRAGFRPDQTERRSAAVGVVGGRTLVAQQLGVQGTAQQTTARNTQQIAQMVAGLPRWLQGIIRSIENAPGAVYQ